MSLMNKLSQLAKSQQGKDLVDKAKTFANDPKTREKIDEARDKFSGHVETAKQKMADKKAKDGSDGSPHYGETSEPATQRAAGSQGVHEEAGAGSHDVPSGGPTYGEEEGDKPLYGEDGPKAA